MLSELKFSIIITSMSKEIYPRKQAPFITGVFAAVLITGCSAFGTNDEKSINTLPPATPTINESPSSLEIFKTDQ